MSVAAGLGRDLETLGQRDTQAEFVRRSTLLELNSQYERVIDDPNLVVVPAVGYPMGDITGIGMDNERAVETSNIINSFGLRQPEVSVAGFQACVESIRYVSDAEKAKRYGNRA